MSDELLIYPLFQCNWQSQVHFNIFKQKIPLRLNIFILLSIHDATVRIRGRAVRPKEMHSEEISTCWLDKISQNDAENTV
jgi:hypothetical protein